MLLACSIKDIPDIGFPAFKFCHHGLTVYSFNPFILKPVYPVAIVTSRGYDITRAITKQNKLSAFTMHLIWKFLKIHNYDFLELRTFVRTALKRARHAKQAYNKFITEETGDAFSQTYVYNADLPSARAIEIRFKSSLAECRSLNKNNDNNRKLSVDLSIIKRDAVLEQVRKSIQEVRPRSQVVLDTRAVNQKVTNYCSVEKYEMVNKRHTNVKTKFCKRNKYQNVKNNRSEKKLSRSMRRAAKFRAIKREQRVHAMLKKEGIPKLQDSFVRKGYCDFTPRPQYYSYPEVRRIKDDIRLLEEQSREIKIGYFAEDKRLKLKLLNKKRKLLDQELKTCQHPITDYGIIFNERDMIQLAKNCQYQYFETRYPRMVRNQDYFNQ